MVLIHDVDDARSAQRARVVRLAAGRGIERGAIEIDRTAAVCGVDDLGVKLEESGVGVIETLGQRGREEQCSVNCC
jgi:hypothetical protein